MTKTWFITGTSSGFGRLMTEQLLARGDRVAATLRRSGTLDDLKRRHPDRLWVAPLDVTDADAVRDTLAQASGELGRLDVVVSNAGYGLVGAAEEATDAQIRRQVETNLLGSIHVIRAAIPLLRAQGGGRILQVSSEGGQIAYPGFSLYHATKWGIEGFVEAVAQEVASFGITVTIAEPGPASTGFGAGAEMTAAMDDYADTMVGVIRRGLAAGTGFAVRSRPSDVALAMIEAAEREPAPKRLVMGPGPYERVRTALTERLAAIEAQRDAAFAVRDE